MKSLNWQHLLCLVVILFVLFYSVSYVVAASQGYSGGVLILLVDEAGSPLSYMSGLEVWAQVWAIDPGTIPPIVEVYRGVVSDGKIFVSARDESFRRVLEGWARMYPRDERYETFLEVFVWIKHRETVRTYPPIIINYNPLRAMGSTLYRCAMLNVHLEVDEGIKPVWVWQATQLSGGYPIWIPDYNLSWFSGDYIETPILMVHNDYNANGQSGIIFADIHIMEVYITEFKVSVGFDLNLAEKILSGIIPDIKIQILGASFSTCRRFENSTSILPGGKCYFFINAKAAHVHAREYIFSGGQMYPTGRERVDDYIYDVQVSGKRFAGGVKSGASPYEDQIFSGSDEEWLIISGTELSDGYLSPGEAVYFSQIIEYYDVYQQDVEMGIPVGSMAAKLGNFPTPVKNFLSRIAVSLSYAKTAVLMVPGTLSNVITSNVSEKVYCRVSKYHYITSTCYYEFKVPMGIYFRFA